jgi:hypothetical protein
MSDDITRLVTMVMDRKEEMRILQNLLKEVALALSENLERLEKNGAAMQQQITRLADLLVQIAHKPPPDVTVNAPDVNVPAAVINVPTPVVTVLPTTESSGWDLVIAQRDENGRARKYSLDPRKPI